MLPRILPKKSRLSIAVRLVSCFVLCAAIGAVSYGVTGCRSGSDKERIAQLAAATENMKVGAWIGSEMRFQGYVEREPNPNPEVGKLLFGLYCSECHSAGKGIVLEGHYQTNPGVESDVHIIKYGLRQMKGFNTRLTHFQMLDILAYLEKRWNDAHGDK